jgi:DNA modification methylase
MAQLEIVYLSPHDLKPYQGNTRKHAPDDIDQIKASIEADGFNDPIGIWGEENLIVEGHGRQIAALEMGLEKVPCIRLDHMTDTQRRDYAIRHNRTAELSAWDFGKLEEEIARLEIEGVDLSGLKFEFPGLDDFTDAKTEYEDSAIPDVPDEAITKRGDIWRLGNHILMCGDSTDANDIAKLMNGEKAKMLFTSPPYSDMREYEGGKDLSVSNLAQFISAYRPYVDYQCVNLGIQRKNNDIYEYWNEYIRIARDSGYKMLAWNVWDKGMTGNIGQAAAFFPLRHEWVFVFGTEFFEINLTWEKKEESITDNPGRKTKRNADGTTSVHSTGDTTKPFKQMESVLFCHPVLDNDVRAMHPATFPVDLPGEYIKAMSNRDDIIIEPFGGSGTTLIACETLNRKCRIMELEPKYCDVIIKRFEDFTRLKAVLVNA